ncbi:MAG: DUF4190 domain-containing protein [Lachnospiraceae bacterium]|nr:DUF4190 domain-containing protein [Lachnospiraceae bacterium]
MDNNNMNYNNQNGNDYYSGQYTDSNNMNVNFDQGNNYNNVNYDSNKPNGLQIAALVLGIISIVCCCCGLLDSVFAVIGLILAIVGNQKNKAGLGKAALIISIIGLVLSVGNFVVNIASGAGSAYMSNPDEFMEMYESIIEGLN